MEAEGSGVDRHCDQRLDDTDLLQGRAQLVVFDGTSEFADPWNHVM
jgi:hypothetical protein